MAGDIHIETPPDWWSDAVVLRRQLHQYPELRFAEHRTGRVLAARLEAAGYEVRTGVAMTGVVATMRRTGSDGHIVLRADMDALNVPDAKDVAYRSRNDGVSHACGHDVHMAVMVTVAEQLARRDWCGQVTVLFQPAEEIPYGEASGAQAVIDSGAIDFDNVDAVLGMHCWPSLPKGAVGIDEHVAMAAKDAFRIIIRGEGSHAASPSRGRDAILAISHIVMLFHQLVSRRVDPSGHAALNVGTVSGGRGQSVVPDWAEIVGTLRTTDADVRKRLKKAMEQVCQGVCLATDTESRFEWANAMPAVRNDPEFTLRAVEALSRLPSLTVRRSTTPPMTTDDFALFAERAPALYFKLGTCGDGEECAPLHSSRFEVDERAIEHGVRAALTIALNELQRLSGG